MNILITGAFSSHNRGDAARVKCSVKMLKALMPDSHYFFQTSHLDVDQQIYQDSEIQVIHKYKYSRRFENSSLYEFAKMIESLLLFLGAIVWRISRGAFEIFRCNELIQYDMFIDLSGESLTEYYGQVPLIWCLYPILLGVILRRQVVIYAQSVGPFDKKMNRILARFVLNKVALVTVRDEYSIEYLKRYHISKPQIYLTADPAFILEPVPPQRVIAMLRKEGVAKSDRPLVGISVSRGTFKRWTSGVKDIDLRHKEFLKVIASLVEYIVDHLNADVILIPHVITPRRNGQPIYQEDDGTVLEDLYQQIEKKKQVKVLLGDYTSEELKGIIGMCDLFLGSRMHANIAALSSYVPTIAIAYSHKMFSLMERLGMGNYVCDVETITLEGAVSKVRETWNNKNKIHDQLEQVVEEMKRVSTENARLVKDLIYDGAPQPSLIA